VSARTRLIAHWTDPGAAAARSRAGAGRQRYTRFVGLMKYLLPLGALVLVALVTVWPEATRAPELRLAYAALTAGLGDAPGMTAARYVGVDGELRPYVVTADSAVVDDHNADRVHLTGLQADITLDDGWLSLLSASGTYDAAMATLDLTAPVHLYSDRGFEFHTLHAHLDLRSGSGRSDAPVTGQGPLGTLHAQAFSFADRGAHLAFSGGVRVVVLPGAQP